jgi:hypothetical protein
MEAALIAAPGSVIRTARLPEAPAKSGAGLDLGEALRYLKPYS